MLKKNLFTKENKNEKLLKKLTKSNYAKDNKFVKLLITVITNFLKKKRNSLENIACWKNDEIDRSTLYSLDSLLQLLHADVANLAFIGKSDADPKYYVVIVNLFCSKTFVYSTK